MVAREGENFEGIYGRYWDRYVERWADANKRLGEKYQWPGDEWGSPDGWEVLYRELSLPAGMEHWQQAVEIGPGSGKYTLKVLADSQALVRAYDVSTQFLRVCETRCEEWIRQGRLSLHLLSADRPDQMLSNLNHCGWQRNTDAFYSIDAMVHVDLQYLIVYLITAALTLKPGGKLILTLADATRDPGFMKLLKDILWTYPAQRSPSGSGKFEWLSPDIVQSILPRLGFRLDFFSDRQRDMRLIASLNEPQAADRLLRYIMPEAPTQLLKESLTEKKQRLLRLKSERECYAPSGRERVLELEKQSACLEREIYRLQLICQIREVAGSILPYNVKVIVISRGDDKLLDLGMQQGWHFPQTEHGVYSGHYPANSVEAIAHLEMLRAKGGDFLLLPSASFWWLDYYQDFHLHLNTHYRRIWQDENCIIYLLTQPKSGNTWVG
jgi:SAM-dependent methyltransferase